MMRGHNISTPFIRVTTSYPLYGQSVSQPFVQVKNTWVVQQECQVATTRRIILVLFVKCKVMNYNFHHALKQRNRENWRKTGEKHNIEFDNKGLAAWSCLWPCTTRLFPPIPSISFAFLSIWLESFPNFMWKQYIDNLIINYRLRILNTFLLSPILIFFSPLSV